MAQSSSAGPGARPAMSRFAIPAALLVLAAAGWYWSARMAGGMTDAAAPTDPAHHGAMPMDPSSHGAMGAMHAPGHDAMDVGTHGAMDVGTHDSGMTAGPGPAPDDSMGMSGPGAMGLGGFLVAWVAMMTAMMFPAITPVVKLYARAAAARRVAPLPFFVSGYLVVWTVLGLPAYVAWRELAEPLAAGLSWVGRLAGAVLIAAAGWQLSPLKSACLRHCRSPLSFFMRYGRALARPWGALRMGGLHGLICVGCCWALMAVLVALGTMNLAWMVGLAALILLEKNAPAGHRIAQAAAVVFAATGLALVLRPALITALT